MFHLSFKKHAKNLYCFFLKASKESILCYLFLWKDQKIYFVLFINWCFQRICIVSYFFSERSKDLFCFIYSFGRIERSIYSFGSIKKSKLFYLKASAEPIYFLFLLLCFQKNLYCSIYSFKSIKGFILFCLFFWMDQRTYIILFKKTERTYIIYLFNII